METMDDSRYAIAIRTDRQSAPGFFVLERSDDVPQVPCPCFVTLEWFTTYDEAKRMVEELQEMERRALAQGLSEAINDRTGGTT
jgi:hypothetical protein